MRKSLVMSVENFLINGSPSYLFANTLVEFLLAELSQIVRAGNEAAGTLLVPERLFFITKKLNC